ncbi:MAG TPA: nucleoside transporter C-terminal domain-containing protein [Gemmataceae bacterium]|jgi:CNT family concentrative nucleoside transporter|nr:nucleoside transporter C-terminal domain-containing protein [Gemmataceae bacterium]
MSSPAPGTPWYWRVGLIKGAVLLTAVAWVFRDAIGVRGQALVGIPCFLAVAAAFSADLRRVNWRTVATGLALQFLLAVLILQVDAVYRVFELMGRGVAKFLDFANEGAEFVFGPLAKPKVAGSAFGPEGAVIFAFRVLPTIIFVSAVFTVLYHLRVLQLVVWVFARAMMLVFGRKGVSGAEALAASANVFMGQTEAPLIIKPYVASMTKSELLALMIGGMATISGGLIAVYISFGADAVAILATSVMAAPAGLYLAKLLWPETEEPVTRGEVKLADERPHANVIDAAAAGASDGMMLAINVAAMLIAFIAGIAMVNYLLRQLGPEIGVPQLSLEWLFSNVFRPVAFLTGVAPEDTPLVGELLGKKLVLNEFVAFADLTGTYGVKDADGTFVGVQGMQERSYKLAVYALTGFANFASIGIQLGGIGAMAPGRRKDLAQLGLRALLGGFLATLINAAIAGLLM